MKEKKQHYGLLPNSIIPPKEKIMEKTKNHNIVFKAIVGSQAYGTSVPSSDVDHKGIYQQPNNDILGFNYKEQIDVTKDECYYEIRRFLELASKANPTILELLFSPKDCIVTTSPQHERLVEIRNKFLTKECRNSFGGYAVQQIQKAKGLNKKMNWEKERIERKTPLDFCYVPFQSGSIPLKDWLTTQGFKQEDCGLAKINHMEGCYNLFWLPNIGMKGVVGNDSNSIRLSSIPKGELPKILISYNEEAYQRHCRDFGSYQEWLEKRNTQRYVDVENHGQQIDGKNLMHCRRLLDMAMEIAETGTLQVRRSNAEYLLSIRQGKVSLEDIIVQAEEDIQRMNEMFLKSNLPDKVDENFVNDLLLEMRLNYGK